MIFRFFEYSPDKICRDLTRPNKANQKNARHKLPYAICHDVAQIAELQSAGAAVTRRMASSISLQDVTQNESIWRVPEPYRKMAHNVFAFLYEFQRRIQLPDTAQPNWPKQASEAINPRRCTTTLCY